MAQNQAAWLDGAQAKLRVGDLDMPKADADRVIVRNHVVAVNPVDWKVQDYGVILKQWPNVLGEDIAGEVVEVGEQVKTLKKGDRVVAHGDSLVSNKPVDGGFALYSSVPASTTAVIPSSISFADAAVLPLAFDTAAVGLYATAEGHFGLPFPSLNPSPIGKSIVVWGGSSSVGVVTIQLAVASGVKVITVASPRNFDLCKKCGATEVLDYKDPSVVENVVNAIKTVGGTFIGVYDAIGLPDQSYKYVLAILEKMGGGMLATVLSAPAEVPSNVKVGAVFGINPVTHPLWKDYVTKAMESGQLKCLPEPLIIGQGLASIQKGLDENKKGVSGQKVVIQL